MFTDTAKGNHKAAGIDADEMLCVVAVGGITVERGVPGSEGCDQEAIRGSTE